MLSASPLLGLRGYVHDAFRRALEWHSRGQRFDPAYLHQTKTTRTFVRVVFGWLQERRSHGAGLLRFAPRSVGQTVRPRLSPSNEKHWKHYVFSAFSFAFWSGFSLALAAAPALSPVSISTDESAELILRLLCSGRVYPRLSSYRRDPHPSVRRAFGQRKPARERFSA